MKAKPKPARAKPKEKDETAEYLQRTIGLASEERAEILAIVCEPPVAQFPTGETARYGSAFRDGVAAYRKLIAARG
jgi:hypothetical protein